MYNYLRGEPEISLIYYHFLHQWLIFVDEDDLWGRRTLIIRGVQ